ncbi:MAG: PACE efflux transporter [Pseudomonadota bacterium]
MKKTKALRSGKDRIRYTVAFEASLMAILIPAGALFFGKGVIEIGLLGAILVVKAMAIGLLYNCIFDWLEAGTGRVSSDRPTHLRILHAAGFELSLVTTSLPILCWWLQLSVLEALTIDLAVTSFVVVYTYVFTLAYDRLFPVAPLPVQLGST